MPWEYRKKVGNFGSEFENLKKTYPLLKCVKLFNFWIFPNTLSNFTYVFSKYSTLGNYYIFSHSLFPPLGLYSAGKSSTHLYSFYFKTSKTSKCPDLAQSVPRRTRSLRRAWSSSCIPSGIQDVAWPSALAGWSPLSHHLRWHHSRTQMMWLEKNSKMTQRNTQFWWPFKRPLPHWAD